MSDEINFLELAEMIQAEQKKIEVPRPSVWSGGEGAAIPVELRIGRLLFLMSKMRGELDNASRPLVDRWLLEGGSVGKLADVTGISRQTLTRRKRRLKELHGDTENEY